MLPFLNKHKQSVAGLIIKRREPDESADKKEPEGDEVLEAAASDILNAIESKDHRHLALALRAAFDILESEPHKEGPHTDEEEEE